MTGDIARNRAVYHSSAVNYSNTGHLVTQDAEIPWISAGNGEEWLLVDLGAVSEISGISVRFGKEYAASFRIELSGDAKSFVPAGSGCGAAEGTTEAAIQGTARYVRLLFLECSGAHYTVYRVSVSGTNELRYSAGPLPPALEDGTQLLTGGNWRVARASELPPDPELLSSDTYDDSGWLPAVVPGTVLTSYLEAGAVPDPFYDDDQFQVSEEFFTSDFWYRNHFRIPDSGRRVLLDFECINWKADVYLNGTFLENESPGRSHSIEGAFIRAEFDITKLIRPGCENVLLVHIFANETPGLVTTQGLAYGPGPNGGLLGADNPTYHAAVGWDWLPTIRGRDIGITGAVHLRFSGDVQLLDPWMETELRLISDTTAIPVEDLMLRSSVRSDGQPGPVREWHGKAGSSFTVDLGETLPIGTVTFVWGTEAGGAAADLESRHPESFRVEVSEDGERFVNLDAYPGGKADIRFIGETEAEACEGTDVFSGHAISDTLPGACAHILLDLTRFGRGMQELNLIQPQKMRYLRFTVLEARELNGRAVDTIVRKMRVYPESPEHVEQALKHNYVLDTEKAALCFRSELKNRSAKEEHVCISGRILPEGPAFSESFTLAANTVREIRIPLELDKPRLWWPNTYGEQYLYTVEAAVLVNGSVSERKSFRFGMRRFDYPIEGGLLSLYCNGVRIVAKGGNWGMDDGLKRDTRKSLFDKVRLHAEAHMTMIRNWVGMTSHPAFYEACDTYGVLIWDDFWLANPVDGPDPKDPEMFLKNAADKIRACRSHPALAVYCGRNEGDPPEEIDRGLRTLTKTLDGSRLYFPHSAAAPVGSGGGYALAKPGEAFGVKQYFNDVTSSVLRSERGIPNVPEYESVLKFVRPEHLWPISETWALHDWTYHMNGPANTYMEALKNYLGGDFEVPEDHVQGQAPKDEDPVFRAYKAAIGKMCREAAECWDVRDFFQAAQLINYDHHRGLFEAVSARLSNGLLMWMSQSSWPSFMWQTYDYYLYCNGGYFGSMAGNRPVKAFFDPRDRRILLANTSPDTVRGLLVKEELFDLYGGKCLEREYHVPELPADAYGIRLDTADLSASGTDLVFLRLSLYGSDGSMFSQNTYWHNRKTYQDHRALQDIPETELKLRVLSVQYVTGAPDDHTMVRITFEVQNGAYPALNTRVRVLSGDGNDVLPVFFSDNYLLLMPGETRIVSAEFDEEYYNDRLTYEVCAWNSR